MASAPVQSHNTKGAFLGLAAFAVFSIHDVIIKQLGGTYSTFQIVFYSALLTFPLLTLVMIGDSRPGTLRPRHPWWLALRSISGSVSALSAFYAFSVLPLAEVYAFIFASPLIVTVLAIPILGETIRLRRGAAVLLGLVGVMVVLQPGASPLTTGHIAALVAAVAGATAAVVVRKIGREERGVVMILYPMMVNLFVAALALPFVYVPVAIEDLGWLALDAILVLIAMATLVAAYSRASAIFVAPMQYSQIIWGVAFGALLFGEYPGRNVYAGVAIIALSGLYILRREASGTASENTPVLKTRTRAGLSSGLRVGVLLRRWRGR